jgi:hypothetical protein
MRIPLHHDPYAVKMAKTWIEERDSGGRAAPG